MRKIPFMLMAIKKNAFLTVMLKIPLLKTAKERIGVMLLALARDIGPGIMQDH